MTLSFAYATNFRRMFKCAANRPHKTLNIPEKTKSFHGRFTLVWIAEKTLVDKNQNKVFKLRL